MRVIQAVWIVVASGTVATALGISYAHMRGDAQEIRVSVAIPQLCNGGDGKPAMPRFLPYRYVTERFPVVIENASSKPEHL